MVYAAGAAPVVGACHDIVMEVPDTEPVSAVGFPGTRTGSAISFDGALTPTLFCAATRMKYVPAATPVADNVVVVLPVGVLPMSVRPGAEPAWITYDVGAPPATGGFHDSLIDEALALPTRLVGAPGGAVDDSWKNSVIARAAAV